MSRPKKLPPIHPGEILLEEFLKPLGMSMNKLADELHVPANRITQIVDRRRRVTGETALRLAQYLISGGVFRGCGSSKMTINRITKSSA